MKSFFIKDFTLFQTLLESISTFFCLFYYCIHFETAEKRRMQQANKDFYWFQSIFSHFDNCFPEKEKETKT